MTTGVNAPLKERSAKKNRAELKSPHLLIWQLPKTWNASFIKCLRQTEGIEPKTPIFAADRRQSEEMLLLRNARRKVRGERIARRFGRAIGPILPKLINFTAHPK